MERLGVRIVESLTEWGLDAAETTPSAATCFTRPAWQRLIGSLDLSSVIGGDVERRYAVLLRQGEPIGAYPVLRVSGADAYFLYRLSGHYFEHWIEDARRVSPDEAAKFEKIERGVAAYRWLLERCSTQLDECLLVTNPISYRCALPVGPLQGKPAREAWLALTHGLQQLARRERLPLWFLGVEEGDHGLRRTLADAGCAASYLFADNYLDLGGWSDFDDYLGSFRRTTRRAFQRDIRRTVEAGIQFRFQSNFDRHAERLTELYDATYANYGESYFRHSPDFWRTLKATHGDDVEAVLAWRGAELIGFSILLHDRVRGELWTYRIGRDRQAAADVPFYFDLSFYQPIRRALTCGYRRLWLGPASYPAKSVRGACTQPLWSYFWFPRRWDRWVLQPYLQLFGRVSREEIEKTQVRVAEPDSDRSVRPAAKRAA